MKNRREQLMQGEIKHFMIYCFLCININLSLVSAGLQLGNVCSELLRGTVLGAATGRICCNIELKQNCTTESVSLRIKIIVDFALLK